MKSSYSMQIHILFTGYICWDTYETRVVYTENIFYVSVDTKV